MNSLFITLETKLGRDGGYVDKIVTSIASITITYMDGNVKNYDMSIIQDMKLELRRYPR